MKPSPMLEEIRTKSRRTLYAICKLPNGMLQEGRTDCGSMVYASTDRLAIQRLADRVGLDVVAFDERIDRHPGVSPGGEGVTRELADKAIMPVLERHIRGVNAEAWVMMREELQDAILALFRPTSPDPARAIEREGK